MRLKVILVPVNGVDEAAVPLAMAIRMARAADARVECVHAALDPQASVPYFGEGMTGAMVEDVMNAIAREEEQRGKRAREQVEAACKASDAGALGAPPTGMGPGRGVRTHHR